MTRDALGRYLPGAPRTDARADLLDSIRTLGTADTHDLHDHTGRTLKAIRQMLPILERDGLIRRVGRTTGTGGRARLRWGAAA